MNVKTAKQTCESRLGSVGGSRTKTTQKIELSGDRNSQKIHVTRPATAKRLYTPDLESEAFLFVALTEEIVFGFETDRTPAEESERAT